MTRPPDEPTTGWERIIDAISDGKRVEWEKEGENTGADPGTLAAYQLIDKIARLHRGGSTSETDMGEAEEAPREWGSLTIRGPLGGGANGEVFRAFDPGLQREVALKLWSATVQPHTIERLLEEARSLARVRHSNVLLVHGADVHDGQVGMWTELVEGSTLEDLIRQLGTGHWREVALYGIQLSRALGAVHAIGFVHRDVKPANIMREHGGRLVLMDFGSATRHPATADERVSGEEGTPLTMAPEVLRGAPATPVSDIYSLGAVLFRMATGRYPAEADTLEGLSAIHERGPLPSATQIRPEVSLALSSVLDRALARDPAERIASAAEFERLLRDALSSDWPMPPWRKIAIGLAAAAVIVAAVVVGVSTWRRGPSGLAAPMQFTLQLPRGERLYQFANIVVSPDGRRIVFAAVDTLGDRSLWVRAFDARASTKIPGTLGATNPFWSPDSRHIGFFSGVSLKRVGVDGDSARVVCAADYGRGGAWNRHGTILFAGSTRGPIMQVPAEGGTPIPVTTLDTLNGESSHRWPHFLPDGEHFLFVTTPEREGLYPLCVGSLRSDRCVQVGAVGSGAVYTSGLLVYMLNHSLEARPFDLRSLRWSGEPTPIVSIAGDGGSIAEPHASASQNGTLVYSFEAARDSRLTWLNVNTNHATTIATGPYFDPRLSPDGRRIAAERVEGTGKSNVWLVDVSTGHAERWTDSPGLDRRPTWSPDGDSIVYANNRSGRYDLFARRADGSLGERLVLSSGKSLTMSASDWQADGLFVLDVYEQGGTNNVYEWRAGVRKPIATSEAYEISGSISPDGHWIAFESNATGRPRIHVVDRRTSERYVLPGEGGMRPRWARETGHLFFHTPGGQFFEATPVASARPPEWPVKPLFRTGVLWGFDVDARGEHVIASVRSDSDRLDEIVVLVNLPRAVEQGL